LTCKKWKTKTITHQLASIKWDALTPPTRIAETWSLAIKSQTKNTLFYKITWLDGSKTRKKTFSGEPWPPPFSRGKRIIDRIPLQKLVLKMCHIAEKLPMLRAIYIIFVAVSASLQSNM
jgi:hypothetical protein